MINIEVVKSNYRRMSDEQLVRFAKLESENLTLESFHALKDELLSRNIDLQIIEELEEVLLLLRTASKENSIDPLTYIKVLELLMRFSDWFQN